MILISTIALIAACSEQAPPNQASVVTASADAVVSAERAFAADGARTGWVEAYEIWAAKDGFVLQSGITNAHAFAANIDPGVRGDTSLAWGPEFAGQSAAGDFGFTAGPFNGDGAAFGYYLTIWRKQPDGAWRWLFEGGVDAIRATTIPLSGAVAEAETPAGGEGSAGAAKAAVVALEAQLAGEAKVNGGVALSAYLAPDSRMQRKNALPAIGAEAVTTALAADPVSLIFMPLRSEASTAGDMVFTLGEARWDDGQGYFTRVWVRGAQGWQVVFDQIIPR